MELRFHGKPMNVSSHLNHNMVIGDQELYLRAPLSRRHKENLRYTSKKIP